MTRLLHALRTRLSGRADSEHEQALIRLAVGFVFTLYLLPDAFRSSKAEEWELFVALGVFQLLAWAIVIAVILRPGVSPARRIVGAVVDSSTASYLMTLLGMSGLPLYVVYLWIIFGNGFRYGRAYLLNTLALCVVGFAGVLIVNDFWREHLGAGIALLLGMVAVSLYVLSLVKRLNEALQRAEAANLAKRQFVSTVSHEMRTPLNAIIGMLELLRDTPLDAEQTEMVKTVGASSKAMLGLVEDVLDFSKIEAGKVTIARESFDLYALCNSAMQVLRAQAEGKGLAFVSTVMPDVPPYVKGDPGHLRQVLINLLANAVKFTEQGSVTLHVSRLGEGDGAVRLKFSIRDTGIGIAPQDQKRIFESFTQADQGVTRRFGGTGLGTTIAKQLVDLMGGDIGVESAVGLGSTFWFQLPLEVDADARPEPDTPEFEGLEVLTIGFPDAPREGVEALVAEWRGRCTPAADVEAAVSTVSAGERRFGCALLYAEDLVEADGLYARLTRGLGAHRLPIVLCAPSGANVHRVPIVHGTYAAVLSLPVDKRILYNALHAFTATEQSDGVVFLSDYLRRRDTGRRLRVLVADDNSVNRNVLAKILERANHEVVLVNNGEEALDAVESRSFDVAILDRNMPRMGGVEAVRAVRALEMGGRRLPVVVLSADVTDEARREAAEAGADLYLTKPVQASRLLEALLTLGGTASEGHAAPRAVEPVRAQPDVEPVLNYETLTLLEGLGSRSDFMEKLIAVFIDDNAQLVDRMEEALEGRRFGEVRSLAHALKGSAGSIGADRLARCCNQFQELAEGDLRMRGRFYTARLRAEFDAARSDLTSYLKKRMSSSG